MAEVTQAQRVELFRQLQQPMTDQIRQYVPGVAWTDHLPDEEDRNSIVRELDDAIESMFLNDDLRCAARFNALLKREQRTAYALFLLIGMYGYAMDAYVDHLLMDADTLLRRIDNAANAR